MAGLPHPLLLPGFTYLPCCGCHLHIVLTQPVQGKIAVVNLTSLHDDDGQEKPGADKTVILHRGDHDWIDHDSYVYYGNAQLATVALLINALQNLGFTEQKPLRPGILKMVQDGLELSPKTKRAKDGTPGELLQFCRDARNSTG